jgi:hypothetical protein
MHPRVHIFDKIRTNKYVYLLKIWTNKVNIQTNKGKIWIGKYRIISAQSEPASAGRNSFIAEQLSTPQGSRCVNKAEDEAVREAAAGGGGEPVG